MASDKNNFTTASFVTEVLASSGRLEKDDVNAKLGKLSSRIQEVKFEVFDALQKKYDDINPNSSHLLSAQDLTGKVKKVYEEMDDTANKIEKEIESQLNVSTAEFQDLSSQLEESYEIQKVLEKLVKIHELSLSVEQSLGCNKYVQAASDLKAIQELLAKPANQMEDKIQILSALKNHHSLQEQKFMNTLGETWSKMVKWTLPTLNGSSGKTGTDSKKSAVSHTELAIHNSNEAKNVLKSTVQALYNIDLLESKLNSFADRFLEHMIKPVMSNPNTTVKEDSKGDKSSVSLVVLSVQNETKDIVTPMEAFSKITIIFEFLYANLLDIEVDIGEEKKETLMESLGNLISGKCIDLVIEECLSHAIPSSNKDIDGFDQVIAITETFQKHLKDLGFIRDDKETLTDFVGNVNALSANKQCQQILEKARALMTSEIHNMAKVDSDHPFSEGLPSLGISGSKKAKLAENMALAADKKLSSNTFKLPTCYISTSVLSLMQLAYSTLDEASHSSSQCAIQLFYCVRNIFELFCTVVVMYHKESLATLPQIAALHHNNCMYLAHHLLTLGHQYHSKLPEPLHSGGAATFVDLVTKLRRLGTECFTEQLKTQRDQLDQSLAGANGFMNLSEASNLANGERAVKQTLYQLQRLSSVWQQVLPANIYCKSMGTLINSAFIKVMSCVTSLEDISADDTTQLHSLMAQMTDRCKQLLDADDGETVVVPQQHVPKWSKFTELMMVLNASLHDIADRWAEGKGPLAHEFNANEMKHLVRALFQNTDRRDAVLSKIK